MSIEQAYHVFIPAGTVLFEALDDNDSDAIISVITQIDQTVYAYRVYHQGRWIGLYFYVMEGRTYYVDSKDVQISAQKRY